MKDLDIDGIGMTSRRTRERLIQRLMDQGIKSTKVLEVIRSIPRHLFLDEALAHRSYEDTALPIGHNQTLSQPYIVAKMTEILMASGELNKVLEIGTGSGYQTAVLASLVGKVYSVERIRQLQDKARQRLSRLSIHNALLRHRDGGMGLPEESPFDGIIVTAAPWQVPQELLEQLSPTGGRLVIPVGNNDSQDLLLIVRNGDDYQSNVIESVRFVPLLAGVI